jgi:hypothetical protein
MLRDADETPQSDAGSVSLRYRVEVHGAEQRGRVVATSKPEAHSASLSSKDACKASCGQSERQLNARCSRCRELIWHSAMATTPTSVPTMIPAQKAIHVIFLAPSWMWNVLNLVLPRLGKPYPICHAGPFTRFLLSPVFLRVTTW